MTGDDSRDVRAVHPGIGDDRQQVPRVINIDGKIQQINIAERAELAFGAEVGQRFLVGQIAVFIGINNRLPIGPVVEHDAIEQRPWIIKVLLGVSFLCTFLISNPYHPDEVQQIITKLYLK